MALEPLIHRLGQQFGERLPQQATALRHELENTLTQLLREGLSRLDLLTRDEFDLQQQILQRTRQKIEALEAQVRQLEQQLTALTQNKTTG